MVPVIEQLARDFDGKVRFGKVNVFDNMDLATRYGATALPKVSLFKNGQVVYQEKGYQAEGPLRKALTEHLS